MKSTTFSDSSTGDNFGGRMIRPVSNDESFHAGEAGAGIESAEAVRRGSEMGSTEAGAVQGSSAPASADVSEARSAQPSRSAGPAARILIVEDDASARKGLTELVRGWGFAAESAVDGEEALARIAEYSPGIILADLVMPRKSGLDLLRAVKERLDDMTFIMITAQGSVDTAVAAMKEGAYDYLTKPVEPQRLRILLERIVERQNTLHEVASLRRQLQDRGQFGETVGSSAAIRRVYRVIEQAAPTDASVLVYGESGTGKELVAQTIHQLSARSAAPFVAINCAAIPETLLESELFGHERGSFTGAVERRQGCFELATKGTLFLDEIAEMAPNTQAKLLRVLQERVVRRLGGQKEIPVDVRIIAATNLNPREAVDQGRLREDLYYRINVVAIPLPPLRDRKEDIPLLVQAFLTELNERNRKAIRAVDQEAMRILERYSWPGNIRELKNVIERALILAPGDFIEAEHLPPDLLDTPAPGAVRPDLALTPGMTVDEAERRLIEVTLAHTGNNKTRAADILGISVKTLHNKLNRYRQEGRPLVLSRDRFPRRPDEAGADAGEAVDEEPHHTVSRPAPPAPWRS